MRFFHPDPHQKSAKRVLRVFLAKKNYTPLKFIFIIFFLDQLFFRKTVEKKPKHVVISHLEVLKNQSEMLSLRSSIQKDRIYCQIYYRRLGHRNHKNRVHINK